MPRPSSCILALLFVFACLPTEAQSPAWIDVPMVWGPTGGPYTCVTRPTGDPRIAIITCDPSRFNQFPVFAQKFLIAHEHGHVYQIVYNPAILYGPYAEYDADCYGAVVLAQTDADSLTATVHWFETVMGPQGGDATHGNGFQMAQRLRQCAASAGVQISQNKRVEHFGNSIIGVSAIAHSCQSAPFEDQRSGLVSIAYQAKGQKLPDAQIVSHGPDDPVERGTPSFCTSLEMLLDSVHSGFWEISMHDGTVRSDISRSIGGPCTVGRSRLDVTCQIQPSQDTGTASVVKRLESCLSTTEWIKTCSDAGCKSANFRHPNDPNDHPIISVTSSQTWISVQISRPAPTAHEHDGFKTK